MTQQTKGQVLYFENVKDAPFGFQTATSDINELSSFYSLKLIKMVYIDKSLNPSRVHLLFQETLHKGHGNSWLQRLNWKKWKGQNNASKDLTDATWEQFIWQQHQWPDQKSLWFICCLFSWKVDEEISWIRNQRMSFPRPCKWWVWKPGFPWATSRV